MHASVQVEIHYGGIIREQQVVTLLDNRINYFGRHPACGDQGMQFNLSGILATDACTVSGFQAMIAYDRNSHIWMLLDGGFVKVPSGKTELYKFCGKTYHRRPSANGVWFNGARVKRSIALQDGMVFNFLLTSYLQIVGTFEIGRTTAPTNYSNQTINDGERTVASTSPLSHIPEEVIFPGPPSTVTPAGELDTLSGSSSNIVRRVNEAHKIVVMVGRSKNSYLSVLLLMVATVAVMLVVAMLMAQVSPDGVVYWWERMQELTD